MSDGRGIGERLAERISGAPPAPPIADPCAWIEERFKVALWSKQREIVEAVHEHRHTTVRAAHSTGKSKVAGLLAAYWIAAHPVGSALVFTTAPRTAQVRGIIWRELGRAHRDGHLPGRLAMGQNPEWWIGDEMVGVGRSPADRADPEEAATAMQGLHAEHLLVIADEAAGLAPWVWDAIDSLASNEGARVLAIGNPTILQSRFAEICKPGSGWHSIKIAAADSPNLTGEAVPASVARNLVSADWVEERAKRWGVESPMYRSRVLAEFPLSDDTALIDPLWIEEAHALELDLEEDPAPIFGLDVARSGSDSTVPAENRDGRIRIRHDAKGDDLAKTTGVLTRLLAEHPYSSGVVDVIGIGAGVYDFASESGLSVRPFNSSERAADPKRFLNARAEGFWELREDLREGVIDLDPADEELAAELLALKWSVDSSGRIRIEGKAELRSRLGGSPDRADAVMMSLGEARGAREGFVLPPPISGPDAADRLAGFSFAERTRGVGGELGWKEW